MINFSNFAAPLFVVAGLALAMGGTSSADLHLRREVSTCPSLPQLHWSLRITWDEPKAPSPPGLILRHRFASHHLLIACSSAQCLMSISEDDRTPTQQGPI